MHNNNKMTILWKNVVIMTLLHVGAIYGLYLHWTSVKLPSRILGKIIGFTSTLGTTIGVHRLWCHRTFKGTTTLQVILMLMASFTYQNSIYTWCRDHRVHHKFSDTDADPQNRTRGVFFGHIGWLFVRKHEDVHTIGKKVDMSDLLSNRILMFQHKYYFIIMFTLNVILPITAMHYIWDENLIEAFFGVVLYKYIVHVNVLWTLNSLGHSDGDKPYDKTIKPSYNNLLQFLTLGEGCHNYHHVFPWDYRSSEIDSDFRNVTTYCINFLAYIGMVTDRRKASKEMIDKRVARTGDGSRNKDPPMLEFFGKFVNKKYLINLNRLFFMGLYVWIV